MSDLDPLIRDGERLPLSGWDFGPVEQRWRRGEPPWDLRAIIKTHFRDKTTLLDLGTGGGEFLSSLQPLPTTAFATEGYEPNLPVARARLEPLGVRVLPIQEDQRIDLPTGSVDLVICRHEAFDPREVARVLRPGGAFVTQQIGGRNYAELDRRFGVPHEEPFNRVDTLADLQGEISEASLAIEDARECSYPERFLDVGAVVYFLRAAPWEVPGFSADRFRAVLEGIHYEIQRVGYWELTAHRLLVVASKNPGREGSTALRPVADEARS